MPIIFDEFKEKAAEILNINLSGYKIKRVQRRTDSLMRRHNIKDYNECLELLAHDSDFKEAYLNHFTINTSEFYRNPQNFEYLQTTIFPALFNNNTKVNIWSAPCSNGSEPYTLAIILNELKYPKNKYRILGSDLDQTILNTAKKGIYGPNSLQNVPAEILDTYFTIFDQEARKYQLKRDILSRVNLEKKDLINESFNKDWDLILSRNFFIYLTSEIKDMLCQKFTDVLKPGGYLFLGNTEFIFNPEQFGLKKVFSSFYQKI